MKKILLLLSLSLLCVGNAFSAVELAKIGSKVITDVDVKKKVGEIPQAQKQILNKDVKARKRLIDNVIAEELFVRAAQSAGVDKDKEFKKNLENTRRSLLARAFIKSKIEPGLNPSAVKKHFNKNKKRYSNDQVRALHILLKTEAEAKEVLKKAKKKGADFKVLAKKHSTDPSAAQNMGDLGFFTRTRMVPEFADAAFVMKKGEIRGPVKTQFGYHVIKKIDSKKGKKTEFKTVQFRVKNDLRTQLMKNLIDGLRRKNSVKLNDSNIGKLKF